ncbi:hypothetical protein CFBP7129_25675 (plasmid) [Agrobacterium tumefaciens]|uniref:Uncharacterized protein n=1 Tax=Agrobacterium tumefaciens TaxID=358 RepID=A0A4D7YRR8_AGRTU|nr:hypothetical protein CFBP7129_25675 [Agrobacterium tumefaciens]
MASGPSGIGSLNCVVFRFPGKFEGSIAAGIGSEALCVGKFKKFEKTTFRDEAKLEAIEREKRTGQPRRHMASAPVTISGSWCGCVSLEQGPVQADLDYWNDGDRLGADGW